METKTSGTVNDSQFRNPGLVKKSIALSVIFAVVFSFASFAQEVGIGTTDPQQMLHVGGAANTVRIDGVATGGSFLTAPSQSTDRLLYTKANGDISAIPAGSAGDVMGIDGSGNPAWMASVGKLVSANTKYTSAPSTHGSTNTTYAQIPNLSETIVVPANTTYIVYVSTDGGFYGVAGTGFWNILRVSLFIDDVESAAGGKRDVLSMNSISSTLANRPGGWSFSKVLVFENNTASPESHTIKVMAKANGTNGGAATNNTIAGGDGSSNQASLSTLVFSL